MSDTKVETINLDVLLNSILESMDKIQNTLESISETQAEVIEKLDNIGLGDGLGLTEYES